MWLAARIIAFTAGGAEGGAIAQAPTKVAVGVSVLVTGAGGVSSPAAETAPVAARATGAHTARHKHTVAKEGRSPCRNIPT
jgi:hypothetical protein